MGKIIVRKDVAEQITGKLKTSENGLKISKNDIFNTEFTENLQNQQVTSKLQANENIFARGDFDEYKISDEELKDESLKSERSLLYKWSLLKEGKRIFS